jgi:hypothetical protein
MRGIDIWLPFVTRKKLSSPKQPIQRPQAAMLISGSATWPLETTKGQSCEAVTYRKKTELLQSANLTKHFSAFAQARSSAAWRLL